MVHAFIRVWSGGAARFICVHSGIGRNGAAKLLRTGYVEGVTTVFQRIVGWGSRRLAYGWPARQSWTRPIYMGLFLKWNPLSGWLYTLLKCLFYFE